MSGRASPLGSRKEEVPTLGSKKEEMLQELTWEKCPQAYSARRTDLVFLPVDNLAASAYLSSLPPGNAVIYDESGQKVGVPVEFAKYT